MAALRFHRRHSGMSNPPTLLPSVMTSRYNSVWGLHQLATAK